MSGRNIPDENKPFIKLGAAAAFVRYLFVQFIENKGMLNASALTYTTLFAVVPLMTVTYAMLAIVSPFQGAGEELQSWIFDNFVPATGNVVQEYLNSFAAQARQLTVVGIVFLVVTSIMMMKNIEAAFNRIWRVGEPRKGLSSFLLYWAVLSLGPILIGVGLFVTSYVASLSLFTSATELVGRGRLLSMLPMLLSAAAFTLLYAAVPNCKVPLRNALIGGIVVALLFETAKRSFAFFVTQSPSYQLIYGAFAAVPLFLLWIYISWVIILIGAELTRALSVYRQELEPAEHSKLHTLLAVLHRLWLAQQRGKSVDERVLLRQVEGLDQSRWDEFVRLLTPGILRRTDQGEYLLARDLGSLTLDQLQQRLPWPLPDATAVAAMEFWQRRLNGRLDDVNEHRKVALDVSLEALFAETAADKADSESAAKLNSPVTKP
ncbi:virulence factor BrkB family protein [Aliamphritea hakodatensis]|uniref:virulence factor BrkB family protein n=1 Tax=Aliamphritea hakodatensis TaxID=2895352 RepID=UPI0022FD9113|nr:virulence factor BrkB family protein [Aliamphritea hakodatensis]